MKTINKLRWPSEPTLGAAHATLGERKVWTDSSGLFRIERFSEGTGEYIAIASAGIVDESLDNPTWGRDKLLGRARNLRAAKAICEK